MGSYSCHLMPASSGTIVQENPSAKSTTVSQYSQYICKLASGDILSYNFEAGRGVRVVDGAALEIYPLISAVCLHAQIRVAPLVSDLPFYA